MSNPPFKEARTSKVVDAVHEHISGIAKDPRRLMAATNIMSTVGVLFRDTPLHGIHSGLAALSGIADTLVRADATVATLNKKGVGLFQAAQNHLDQKNHIYHGVAARMGELMTLNRGKDAANDKTIITEVQPKPDASMPAAVEAIKASATGIVTGGETVKVSPTAANEADITLISPRPIVRGA